jgi:hypothetical protein
MPGASADACASALPPATRHATQCGAPHPPCLCVLHLHVAWDRSLGRAACRGEFDREDERGDASSVGYLPSTHAFAPPPPSLLPPLPSPLHFPPSSRQPLVLEVWRTEATKRNPDTLVGVATVPIASLLSAPAFLRCPLTHRTFATAALYAAHARDLKAQFSALRRIEASAKEWEAAAGIRGASSRAAALSPLAGPPSPPVEGGASGEAEGAAADGGSGQHSPPTGGHRHDEEERAWAAR